MTPFILAYTTLGMLYAQISCMVYEEHYNKSAPISYFIFCTVLWPWLLFNMIVFICRSYK